jgi:hypothetical protein
MERSAVLFIIFIPCRPVGTWRMDPRLEKWVENGSFVELMAKEETNYGGGCTTILI